ncbi:hypothetical protein [Chryseobacterium sp.]|uniref:hypothetical protein n=1 Tax=Chryseobacterium sp. TaxID=1871047 RepID=UPI0024E1B13A|nr:hypothetical protein [Chryseobacterium sp.]
MNNIEEFIKHINNFQNLKNSELIDYFAYYLIRYDNSNSIKAKQIHDCFTYLKIPPYSNISLYLSNNSKKNKGYQKFIKNKDSSYILTRIRIEELEKEIVIDKHIKKINLSLQDLLKRVTNDSEKNYLEEAISTFEIKAYRASIILVWLLTIDHLYEYVLANNISDFVAAMRRAGITKSINSKDDFGSLKESQFIELCKSSGIISNDVRKILDTKLGIRNSFAHPSTITLPKSKALEFIEDLIENVILKY